MANFCIKAVGKPRPNPGENNRFGLPTGLVCSIGEPLMDYSGFIKQMRSQYTTGIAGESKDKEHLAVQIEIDGTLSPCFIVRRSDLYLVAVTLDVYNDTLVELYAHLNKVATENKAQFRVSILNNRSRFLFIVNENYVNNAAEMSKPKLKEAIKECISSLSKDGAQKFTNDHLKVLAFFISEATRFEDIFCTCQCLLEDVSLKIKWQNYRTLMLNWDTGFSKKIMPKRIQDDYATILKNDKGHTELIEYMLQKNVLKPENVTAACHAAYIISREGLGHTAVETAHNTANTTLGKGSSYDEALKSGLKAGRG